MTTDGATDDTAAADAAAVDAAIAATIAATPDDQKRFLPGQIGAALAVVGGDPAEHEPPA